MAIKGLIIRKDGIVHENDIRKVIEIFNDTTNKNELRARNCKSFVIKKDGWIGDHYRNSWETYAVLSGEVNWFFEDTTNGVRENHIFKEGGKVEIPPKVAHALKVKKGTIIVGRYEKSLEDMKTNKYELTWARREK